MHVQLTPVTDPPSEEQLTAVKAAMNAARYSGDVAKIETAGRFAESVEGERYWLARVDGGPEFRVVEHGLQSEDGRVMLSLVLPVDAVSIGDPPLGEQPPQVRPAAPEKPALSTWGSPAADPREKIPGWQPEKLGGQVAEAVMGRLATASRRVGLA